METKGKTGRALHTHFLRVASDALFQDRERHRAAGEPWPEALQEAHDTIKEVLKKREE